MIGRNIYEIRLKKGLSLSELAERANISKSYLSNIERNLNQNPSIHIIKKLAAVLDVDLRSLVKTEINEERQQYLDREWLDFINELKESGVEKEQIQEYKTLIEFIKWKNEQIGEKK
ncbi:helix-turn-helix domain-containing protein [Neobacillus vireti]|uniref:Transcriptional regulator SinR n=1 Tax=Neobacillus vireti LMG 21834 TaxID=1131730 RepID=A0AB94IKJ0_9BACI|nr:helix-turn-helix transcriptional regulator [Neobacillus vireti]ETI67560.1 transcriptional regulator SinR [Neobacillus vireti LMG 21834]KLT18489.1 transcriptional regulator [Neobacillus vireti]